MTLLLEGKTALVTGGTTGIGLAAAQRIAAEGAHVFLTGRSQPSIDSAVASIGASATGIRSDVTDMGDLDAMVAVITDYGHGLDVVFANAGGGEFAALADITPERFFDTFNRDVGGTLFTVQKSVWPCGRRRSTPGRCRSEARTKTPTVLCGNTFRRAPTCHAGLVRKSMPSPRPSTTDPARY